MTAKTNRWKNNERIWPKTLAKYKIEAKRRTRAGNYSESIDDVEILDHPEIISDCKYSVAGFKTNRLLAETDTKYRKSKSDFVIVLTKGYREVGQRACVDSELLAMLLSYWLGKGDKEELLKIYAGD